MHCTFHYHTPTPPLCEIGTCAYTYVCMLLPWSVERVVMSIVSVPLLSPILKCGKECLPPMHAENGWIWNEVEVHVHVYVYTCIYWSYSLPANKRSGSTSPVRSPSPHPLPPFLSSTPTPSLYPSPSHHTYPSPVNRSISKTKYQAIDVLSEYQQRESGGKPQINLVVVGTCMCVCVLCNSIIFMYMHIITFVSFVPRLPLVQIATELHAREESLGTRLYVLVLVVSVAHDVSLCIIMLCFFNIVQCTCKAKIYI